MTSSNRALQVTPGAPASIALADVAEPGPASDQAVIEVAHASANFGELRFAEVLPAGMTLGYDAAGVVLQAAADGSGPAAGERVIAFGPGAWANRVAFSTDSLAVAPGSVDLAQAAALPLAGLTALRTLRALGSLIEKRILITGASGGVGRLAVQLARLGGAHVIAAVGSPASGTGLADLGAHEVVTSLDDVSEPVHGVLETIGGPTLHQAWSLLAPGGSLQTIGWASGEPAVLPVNAFFALGEARTISSFGNVTAPGPDLAILLRLVESGRLSPEVGWQGPWTDVAVAADELFGRRVPGKIVLDIGP